MVSPVAGLTVGKRFPVCDGTNFPSMYRSDCRDVVVDKAIGRRSATCP
jgi:hypothetical protein